MTFVPRATLTLAADICIPAISRVRSDHNLIRICGRFPRLALQQPRIAAFKLPTDASLHTTHRIHNFRTRAELRTSRYQPNPPQLVPWSGLHASKITTHTEPATMQHAVFNHHAYQQPTDWQHHGGGPQHAAPQHQYAHSQSAAGLAQQQQHYGRMNQNGNGNAAAASLAQNLNIARENESIFNPDNSISDENRKVLEWISQVLNANTRESALLELSKKREQVPELALILWHSFGMDSISHMNRSGKVLTRRSKAS